jgi:hypothetical protein
MSKFLNDEQMDQLGAMLDGEPAPAPAPEPEAVESAAAPEEETQAEEPASPEESQPTSESAPVDEKEASSEVTEEAPSTEGAAEEEDTKGSGKHRVPYNRFQEVVHARNKYQSEVDDLRKQQGALQAELKRMQEASSRKAKPKRSEDYGEYDDDDLDQDFIQNGALDEDMEESAPWQNHYKSLEERVQRFELEQAKSHLENVLGEVNEKYPSVPRQAILQHIIDKPPKPSHVREKVFELAERYTSYIAQVEEAAIAKHLESLQVEDVATTAAPRPKKAGSPRAVSAVSAGEKKPKSLKDAKDSLYQFMKDTNPFG